MNSGGEWWMFTKCVCVCQWDNKGKNEIGPPKCYNLLNVASLCPLAVYRETSSLIKHRMIRWPEVFVKRDSKTKSQLVFLIVLFFFIHIPEWFHCAFWKLSNWNILLIVALFTAVSKLLLNLSYESISHSNFTFLVSKSFHAAVSEYALSEMPVSSLQLQMLTISAQLLSWQWKADNCMYCI